MELGKSLRKLRDVHGATLAEVAQVAGISVSHLSAIETGTRPNPSFSVVVKLARFYGVSLDYFLDDADQISMQKTTSMAAETPVAYEQMAKRLADEHALDHPSRLLELIAEYLRQRDGASPSKEE